MELGAVERIAAAVIEHHIGPETVEFLNVSQVHNAVVITVDFISAIEQIVERNIVGSAKRQAENAANNRGAMPWAESWRRHRTTDVVMHRTETAEWRCHRSVPRRWPMMNHSVMVGSWLVAWSAGTSAVADVIASSVMAVIAGATTAHIASARAIATVVSSRMVAYVATRSIIVVGAIAHVGAIVAAA